MAYRRTGKRLRRNINNRRANAQNAVSGDASNTRGTFARVPCPAPSLEITLSLLKGIHSFKREFIRNIYKKTKKTPENVAFYYLLNSNKLQKIDIYYFLKTTEMVNDEWRIIRYLRPFLLKDDNKYHEK